MPLGNTSRRAWLTGLLSIFGLSQVAGAENVVEQLATKISGTGYQSVTHYVYDSQGRLVTVWTPYDQTEISIYEYRVGND